MAVAQTPRSLQPSNKRCDHLHNRQGFQAEDVSNKTFQLDPEDDYCNINRLSSPLVLESENTYSKTCRIETSSSNSTGRISWSSVVSNSPEQRNGTTADEQAVQILPAPLKSSESGLNLYSLIKLKRGDKVRTICPVGNGHTWVLLHGSSFLTLIDDHGNVLRNSVKLQDNIRDAALMTTNFIVVTNYKSTIKLIWPDGASCETFADIKPYFANGLCTTVSNDVLVCTYHHCWNNQVMRFGSKGSVIQIIECKALFSFPYRVKSLTNGNIVVVIKKEKDHKVLCLDSNGNHLVTWKAGKIKDFVPTCVARDEDNNVYVTAHANNQVFALHIENQEIIPLLNNEKHKIPGPFAIAVDGNGRIMVGCDNGRIYKLGKEETH